MERSEVKILEIHIPLYSIYKTKDPNRYQEILQEDSEFYLVREESGEMIINRIQIRKNILIF